MSNILIDTHIFIRLEGEYKYLLECIKECCDIINYSNEILHEYKGRVGPSYLILMNFIRDLETKNKMIYNNRSYIRSKYVRISRVKKIRLSQHSRDNKWIITAFAIKAKYILSKNHHLTDLPPFSNNGDNIEIIDPIKYVDIRCPDHS